MKKYGVWVGILLSAAGYLVLVHTARTDSTALLTVWMGLFLLYGLLVYYHASLSFVLLLGAAVSFRLIGLLAMPSLSDDVYRFVWDGRLLAHGYNPYLYLPAALLDTGISDRTGLTDALFQKLNSPGYYTIYPPLLQGWFGISTLLAATEAGAAFWLRLPILLGELVSIWLLYQLLKGIETKRVQRGVLLYALNPLIVVELTSNVHYEGLTICFLLACLYLFKKERKSISAVFLGLSIGVKLLPLIFLPALLDRTQIRKSLVYTLITGVVTLIPFLFFFDQEVVSRFLTSLDLYFRKFEFNASLYYVLRWAGTRLLGYNPIGILGPLLSLLSLSAILYLSFSRRLAFTLYERLLLILTVYLFCATTVHPWYIGPLVALSALGRFRYALVWSVLLPFTYLAYGQVPFQENLWVVALEYLIVGRWLWWEVGEYGQKTAL
jgi:alpha-1,6-mannosyltransferase